MIQSDKKILEFIKNSGVNYFLQDSPRNWLKNEDLNILKEDKKDKNQ